MAESSVGSFISKKFVKYDVFLNHRGPDTKDRFLVPLEKRLHEAGFVPFLDRLDIGHGEHVFGTIEEAIRTASMHVAVLSKGYAESYHCLTELHQMLETRKPIITVFYDVGPEHVRRPRNSGGPYAEAFKKHDEREKPEDVKNWERALETVAAIRGFVRSDYRNDEDLDREIVKAIETSLPSPLNLEVPNRGGYYDWKFHYKLPTDGRGIVFFAAKSPRNVLVAISPEAKTLDTMYEIKIGGSNNNVTAISRKDRGKDMCLVPGGLLYPAGEEFSHFWVSIDAETELIQVGRGKQPNLASAFCVFKDVNFIGKARYVSFTSLDVSVTYSDISVALLARPTCYSWTPNSMEQSVATVSQTLDVPIVIPPMYGWFDWSSYCELPSEGRGILFFSTESENEVHVAISPQPETVEPMYKIAIGGWDNTYSTIRRKWEGDNMSFVPTGLDEGVNHLWVSINAETEVIQVGRGKEPTLDTVFCVYKDVNFISKARYVSFTTYAAPVTISEVSVVSINPSTSNQNIQEGHRSDGKEVGIVSNFDLPITIPPKYGFFDWLTYFELPAVGQGVVLFATESENEVHVAISPQPETVEPMYKIAIGGWDNTYSTIRRKWEGANLSLVHVGLDKGVNHLWVSIDVETEVIQVGRGKEPTLDTVFCVYKDVNFISKARYVSFTTYAAPVIISEVHLDSISPSLRSHPVQVDVEAMLLPPVQQINIPRRYGDFDWSTYYKFPSAGRGIVSFTTTRNDVYIAISPHPKTVESMYTFTIGGWNNSMSIMFRRDRGLANHDLCTVYTGVIYPFDMDVNQLWVSIDEETQIIMVGRGNQPGLESSVFMVYKDAEFIRDARYISFSSHDEPLSISDVLVFSMNDLYRDKFGGRDTIGSAQ